MAIELNDKEKRAWRLLKSGIILPQLGGYVIRGRMLEGVHTTYQSAATQVTESEEIHAALALCWDCPVIILSYPNGDFQAAYTKTKVFKGNNLADTLTALAWEYADEDEKAEAKRILDEYAGELL